MRNNASLAGSKDLRWPMDIGSGKVFGVKVASSFI